MRIFNVNATFLKNSIKLESKDFKDGYKVIKIDQPIPSVIEEMKEVLNNKKRAVYLTSNMADIDLLKDGHENVWALDDGFYLYVFEIDVNKL